MLTHLKYYMDYTLDKRAETDDNAKQVHSVVLRMLKYLDKICSDHEISFWLEYGTLLGAVRHKGFIPWDNEADVGMLRSDFEKFKSVAQKELPSDIFFQTRESDPDYLKSSVYIEGKLRDKYSNYVAFEKEHPEIKWHNGIQVDIFVYDLVTLNGNPCLVNKFEKTLTNYNSYFLPEELEYLHEIEFEDTTFLVPAGYHKYLERNYGDYLVLPAEKERTFEGADVFNHCNHTEVLKWIKEK